MKHSQKVQAVSLREEGYSLRAIAEKLGVAKSSVSVWVRDIKLSEDQLITLAANPFTGVAIEKRRLARLKNEQKKRDVVVREAEAEIADITKKDLWMIGVTLYWAEGGKTQRLVRFTNGDPRTIKIMMKFFDEICSVAPSKFRGHVHIHSHLDHKEAERYWSRVSGIPSQQFFKTYRRKSVTIADKKDTLPYGVMDIYVLDANLFLKMMGWINGTAQKAI